MVKLTVDQRLALKQPGLTPLRVRHFMLFCSVFLLLIMFSRTGFATLNATVDRTEITENESVQLTISTDLQLSSSLSLFNLNTLSIPQPDVSILEQDFDILDRQQNYRVQIDNNQNNSVITWTYTLMPKVSGAITIPAIEYEGETTEPISLRINQKRAIANEDREVFIKAETDLQEVYVQQQLIYKVRLYYSLDLVSGELEHPSHQDAVFTQIGKQKEFSRYVGSKRFSVIERTYAVFPKVAGDLTIPPVNFSGTFIKRRVGKRVYFKDATAPTDIEVKPPPANFTGNLWLPAQSLSIRDVWSNPAREIRVGDSLTRNVQIMALGLEGVQLPPLPSVSIGGLKVYPEPGKTSTEEHAAGVTGSREEVQALIATGPGNYTLPEIRIPWWDVTKDEERVAILQGRVIKVIGSPAITNSDPALSGTPQPSLNGQILSEEAQLTSDLNNNPDSSPVNQQTLLWKVATAVLLLLWLTTVYLWWRKPRRFSPNQDEMRPVQPQISLDYLEQLAKQGSPEFTNAFNTWLTKFQQNSLFSNAFKSTLTEATRADLIKLQRNLYGPQISQQPDTDLAVQVIDKVKTLLAQQGNGLEGSMPPFYPIKGYTRS